jgi:Co/Zn/Cd efflux system component
MSGRYRRILQIALLANTLMFAVELIGGLHVNSVSLLADAVDFAGDAANYGLSLAVLSMAAVWRSRAALIKGLSMGAYGVFVLIHALWNFVSGTVPEAVTMSAIGASALGVNVAVAGMLYMYRDGDANMRSVWLCTRNDAIGNISVIIAAGAVSWLHTGWPDVLIALSMGLLALQSSRSVVRHARNELSAHAQANAA